MTPINFVEVSPELASERGLTRRHAMCSCAARMGEATVQVLVTDRVQGKQLYMPLNSVMQPVNS